jgi:Uma2 family endonuclease
MALNPTRRKFTVNEYHALGRAGILGEGDRVELIEGEIIQTAPIGPAHADHVMKLTRLLVRTFDDVAWVGVQNPATLTETSEPQPDFALLRYRPEGYPSRLPTGADVHLFIEVSDTTLAFDRRVKVPLYAHVGIPEVWLLDVARKVVHVYRDLEDGRYRTRYVARPDERLAPVAFPDRPLSVADIVGQGKAGAGLT